MAAAEAESGGVQEYRNLFGARVHFPVDLPDAMLKHAIESARRNIAACDDWQSKVRPGAHCLLNGVKGDISRHLTAWPWYSIQGDEAVRKIKAEFDDAYGPSWHVFVGKHFGSKVTHDSKMFTFFYLEASATYCL